MQNHSEEQKWLQDVLKYVIGGVVAAGLVTFIGFLTWRGREETQVEHLTTRLEKLDEGLSKIKESGSYQIQPLQKSIERLEGRLDNFERKFDNRGDILETIIKNQHDILDRLREDEKWNQKMSPAPRK